MQNYVFDGKGNVIFANAKITKRNSEPQFVYNEEQLERIRVMLDKCGVEYTLEHLEMPDIDFGERKFFSSNDVDKF